MARLRGVVVYGLIMIRLGWAWLEMGSKGEVRIWRCVLRMVLVLIRDDWG